jgi:alpha-tubulin suppressor-like RCC1 family protein
MSSQKTTLIITSLIVLSIAPLALSDYRDDSKVIKISGGEDHSLILTSNKCLWSFGANGGDWYVGVLGTGSISDSLCEYVPVRVHGLGDVGFLEDINDFDAGWVHSLAVDVNGFAWSWGNNDYGQIGDGTQYIPRTTPVKVLSGDMGGGTYLHGIIAVAAGRSGAHSLAVDADNFVWSWGQNNVGQLGDGSEGDPQLTPVEVVGGQQGGQWLSYIDEVSGGEDNSVARDANGCVYTWGLNDYGQLGKGYTDGHSNIPLKVLSGQQDPCDPNSFLQCIIAIDSGWDHLLALEKNDPQDANYNGCVYAWGRNSKNTEFTDYGGQLGDGTENDSDTPVKVLSGEQDPGNPDTFLKDIVAVSAGDCHSMALDKNGNVWTWGDNEYGQLGINSSDPCRLTPVKVLGRDGQGYLDNIVAISAG